jgi:hypothetical protein
VIVHGEQHRLLGSGRLAKRTVRQKALLGIGPQMGIERIEALLHGCLHDNAPAPRQRTLQQHRKHPFHGLSLEMVEQEFGHSGGQEHALKPFPSTADGSTQALPRHPGMSRQRCRQT